MLGALLLGVLALTGQDGAMWSNDLAPRAGQPYVAVSYTGTDRFGCGATIGRQSVKTTAYKLDNTTVCVVDIPKGSAGKKLLIGYSVSGQNGPLLFHADGAVKPKLIRR